MRAIFVMLCLAFVWGTPASAAKRVALVIGNSAYQYTKYLANPKNDAADLAAMLEKFGFDVTRARDVTGEQLDQLLADFEDKARGADAALFYFAGHGIQFEKVNYLVPVDARLRTVYSIAREGLAVDQVVRALEGSAGLSLIILDACRNNPQATRLRKRLSARGRAGRTRAAALTRGLGPIASAAGETLIVYAAAPGTEAFDGDGRNSPFARAFIRAVRSRPGAEIESLLKRVRREVKAATRPMARRLGKPVQRPEWLSRLESDFRFGRAKAPRTGGGVAAVRDVSELRRRLARLEAELKRRAGKVGAADGGGPKIAMATKPAPPLAAATLNKRWIRTRVLTAAVRSDNGFVPVYYLRASVRIENVTGREIGLAVFDYGKNSTFTGTRGERCNDGNRTDALRGLPNMWRNTPGGPYQGKSTPLSPGASVVVHLSLECSGPVRSTSGALTAPLYVVVGGKVISSSLSVGDLRLR